VYSGSLQTFISQPGAEGKDAVIGIWTNGPDMEDTNFGYDAYLLGRAWIWPTGFITKRSLIQFDLSSIPSNAMIIDANIYLYSVIHSEHIGNNVCLFQRITAPWNEATVTWNSQPLSVSANQGVMTQTTTGDNVKVADVTLLVNDMVSQPDSNFGFKISLKNETEAYAYQSFTFASTDHDNVFLHPRLVVYYTLPELSMRTGVSSGLVEVRAYPSPFSRQCTLEILGDEDHGDITCHIYELSGLKIKEIVSSGKTMEVEKKNLVGGVYIYKIYSDKKMIGYGKLFVE
jgi:hypothetical protein